MDDTIALAAARAFGRPAGPLRPVRVGRSPVFDLDFADGRRVALRLHDPALARRTIEDRQRLAEALADAGLATPWPQRSHDDALTVTVAGITATVLQWVPASPLAEGPVSAARLHAVGGLLADFHLTADAVAPADLCLPDSRPRVAAHDMADDPALAHAARTARDALDAMTAPPVGLMLDDPGGVLAGADGLWLIGLDRAGTGWRAQDLAAAIWPHADDPGLADRRDALLAGYADGGGDARDATPDTVALCMGLRALQAAANAPQDAAARARVTALLANLAG